MNNAATTTETIRALFVFGAALVGYFIPWLIAVTRSHRNSNAIFALNLLLGWTLIGWVAAIVWALTNQTAQPKSP